MASVPPQPQTDGDDGRLPWVGVGAPTPTALVTAQGDGSATRWFVSLLILALVSAGAFVLGRGSEQTPPPPIAVPLPRAQPAITPEATTDAPTTVAKTPPALARATEEPRTVTKVVRVMTPAPANAGLHLTNEQIRAVRKIAREAQVNVHRGEATKVALRPAYSPKLAPSGRVVQLGAYHSVREAEAAAELFRYKYRGLLASLPKAVLPFRPNGARRKFYRVQFVTPSQAYSEVTCQRLRAAAKTCIVVY